MYSESAKSQSHVSQWKTSFLISGGEDLALRTRLCLLGKVPVKGQAELDF